jgi:hypothetical protein
VFHARLSSVHLYYCQRRRRRRNRREDERLRLEVNFTSKVCLECNSKISAAACRWDAREVVGPWN